jgi:methylthioribose-1-phosphate isomerase
MNHSITVYDLRRAIDGADDLLPVSLRRIDSDHQDPVAICLRYVNGAPRRDGLVIQILDEALSDALSEAEDLSRQLSTAEEQIAELRATKTDLEAAESRIAELEKELAKLKEPVAA